MTDYEKQLYYALEDEEIKQRLKNGEPVNMSEIQQRKQQRALQEFEN
jgi:hypothetical protein